MSTNNNGINKNDTNYYIDKTLYNSQILIDKINSAANKDYFHLPTHGCPGELLINGEWLNAQEIAAFIKQQLLTTNYQPSIDIYGCNSTLQKGNAAITYLEKTFRINVATSYNITKVDGDLEKVTKSHFRQSLNHLFNLQDYNSCILETNANRFCQRFNSSRVLLCSILCTSVAMQLQVQAQNIMKSPYSFDKL